MLNSNFTVKDGHLFMDGIDTVALARDYGTPLYVMSEDTIRKNCKKYKQAIDKYYNGRGLPLYASKAFSCVGIYKIINEEGLGVDIVSGGEMYTALKAGFPASKMYFHGNNKTNDELRLAIENEVGHIVVDNKEELHRLNILAKEYNKIMNISFRIKPGIDAHTHDFIRTGQIDSKFGVALENGEAFDIIKIASSLSNVKVTGVHCHIGSQIFDVEPFILAAKVMLQFIAEVKEKLNIVINELNLGGGFGIKYIESHDPKDYDEYMRLVSEAVKEESERLGIKMPFILVEPGRSITGAAGITLYTVGSVKKIKDVRTYVSIDGGMTDNIRYALYKSDYELAIANKMDKEKDAIVTVAGKCCESGDLIQENAPIQTPETGDTMVVFATGAYNYSMASNYNRIPRPATVMLTEGKPRILIKRETYDDLIINDIL